MQILVDVPYVYSLPLLNYMISPTGAAQGHTALSQSLSCDGDSLDRM
jgi:hypothetical protein